jgi:hypothetical protein
MFPNPSQLCEHFAYDFSVLISDCNASYTPSAAEHKLPFGRGLSRVSLFEVISFLARSELEEYRQSEVRVDDKLRSLVKLYLLP